MSRPFVPLLVTIALLVLLSCAGLVVPIDLLGNLAFGWVFYLRRVLPGVTVDWPGVAMAALCLVLFSAGSHALLGWLYGQIRAKDPGEEAGRWRVRWTSSMVAVVLLMFVAGLSATGIVHQVGWLMDSRMTTFGIPSLAARRAQSSNNLKQIGLGLHAYEASHATFPPGGMFDALGRPMHGWMTMILPGMDDFGLLEQIDFTIPWDDPRNRDAFRTEVSMFQNPGIDLAIEQGTGYALAHYAGNVHVVGGDRPRTPDSIRDGLSNTIVGGEVAAGFVPWGAATNWRDPALGINRSPDGFGGPFPGGANFLLGDGSVRFLKDSIDPEVFRALGTPDGGEAIAPGAY